MNKKYITFDQSKGYLVDKSIYYECVLCHAIVNSNPNHFDSCACGNIEVDSDMGRIVIKNKNKFKVFKFT